MGQEDKNESLGPAEEGSSLFPQALGFDLGPQLVRIIQRNQQDVERKRKRFKGIVSCYCGVGKYETCRAG